MIVEGMAAIAFAGFAFVVRRNPQTRGWLRFSPPL